MLEYFSDNLRNKYSKNSRNGNNATPNEYLQNNITCTLSNEQSRALDEPISFNELHFALKSMKSGKTPGSNSFTADFFKHLWSYIGCFLYRAWLERLQENKNLVTHNETL